MKNYIIPDHLFLNLPYIKNYSKKYTENTSWLVKCTNENVKHYNKEVWTIPLTGTNGAPAMSPSWTLIWKPGMTKYSCRKYGLSIG